MREQSEGYVVKRVATGIDGLDDVLHGGLIPHQLYLVEGHPGTGKTTLALQYLLTGQQRGERGLYVTLSETARELHAVAAAHGWSLAGIEVIELIPDETSIDLDVQNTMFHPSEVELPEILKTMLTAVEQTMPSRIVIDSLSELRLLAQHDLRYRRSILALKQFFTGRKSTVLLLDDRTARDMDAHVQSIAHGVISLEELPQEYGAERRRLRVLKLRGTAYRGGYHDFRIVRGGLRVYPRLVAAEHHRPFVPEQQGSGIAALDAMLGGGLDRGTSTLIIGPAGTGKSSICTQYAVAAADRGHHATMILFEEQLTTMLSRSEGLGMDLRSHLAADQIAVHQFNPAEISPGEFIQLIRSSVEQRGTRILIIDSLNGYLNAMPEERFLLIQLHELFSYLCQLGVTTILTLAQSGLVGQHMSSPIDVSYLADTILVLRYFELDGELRQALSVLKRRSGPRDGTIRELHMSGDGIQIGAPLRGFRGILTGLPVASGDKGLEKEQSQ